MSLFGFYMNMPGSLSPYTHMYIPHTCIIQTHTHTHTQKRKTKRDRERKNRNRWRHRKTKTLIQYPGLPQKSFHPALTTLLGVGSSEPPDPEFLVNNSLSPDLSAYSCSEH